MILYYNKLEGDDMEAINSFVDFLTSFLSSGGIIFGFLLVLLESAIPALPLGVFVALNIHAFGFFIGIFISWLATCIGCAISYFIFYNLSNKIIYKLLSKNTKNKIDKAIKKFQKISFSNLVIIIALPFTPAFLVNIICGIASISKKKFLIAIAIGKIFMITFWGYIGKSLIESMTDINTIIFVSLMLVMAYIISKFVGKKVNIE